MTNRTTREILQSLALPEGFKYTAINFTEDGWILSSPDGVDLEIGTIEDDMVERAGYAWREYEGPMEEGGIINYGGVPTEDEFVAMLTTFIDTTRPEDRAGARAQGRRSPAPGHGRQVHHLHQQDRGPEVNDTPIYIEALREAKRRTKRDSPERRTLEAMDRNTTPAPH